MCVPLPVQGAGGCGNRDAVVFPGLEHQAERAAQLIQQGELAQQYGVRGIPTMILVDQNGTIVATSHQVGTLVEKAEKLLTNPPAADGAKDAEQPKAN